ncbi:hypothetical protein RUND412_007550 [Rhizina undulata]
MDSSPEDIEVIIYEYPLKHDQLRKTFVQMDQISTAIWSKRRIRMILLQKRFIELLIFLQTWKAMKSIMYQREPLQDLLGDLIDEIEEEKEQVDQWQYERFTKLVLMVFNYNSDHDLCEAILDLFCRPVDPSNLAQSELYEEIDSILAIELKRCLF